MLQRKNRKLTTENKIKLKLHKDFLINLLNFRNSLILRQLRDFPTDHTYVIGNKCMNHTILFI